MPELNLSFAPEPPWLKGTVDTSKALRDALSVQDMGMRKREQNTMLPLRERAAQQDIAMNDMRLQQTYEQRQQMLQAQSTLNNLMTESQDLFQSGDSMQAMNFLLESGRRNPILFKSPEYHALLKNAEMAVKAQDAQMNLQMRQKYYQDRIDIEQQKLDRPDQGQSFRPSDPIQLRQAYDDAVAKGDQMGIEYFGGLMRQATGKSAVTVRRDIYKQRADTLKQERKAVLDSYMDDGTKNAALKSIDAELSQLDKFLINDPDAQTPGVRERPEPESRTIQQARKALEKLQSMERQGVKEASVTEDEDNDWVVKGDQWWGDEPIDRVIERYQKLIQESDSGRGVTMPPQESTGRNQPQINMPTIRYNSTNDTITPR